jgi:hypothetical protein
MSKANPNSVQFFGANAKSELVGLKQCNEGLRILVYEKQAKGSGRRVRGHFKLLEAGTGRYREYLKEFVGGTFTAKDLIDIVCQKIRSEEGKALKGLQVLNCNLLGIDKNSWEKARQILKNAPDNEVDDFDKL